MLASSNIKNKTGELNVVSVFAFVVFISWSNLFTPELLKDLQRNKRPEERKRHLSNCIVNFSFHSAAFIFHFASAIF